MSDNLSTSQRYASMSSNTGKGTQPEMVVRRLVHSLGYRYRLHRRDLPGCPDMTFPRRKKVVFVNGCYWHRHNCKKGRSVPQTRAVFWQTKFERTKQRDKRNRIALKKLGWQVMTIWECQINDETLTQMLIDFLQ